MKKIKKTLPVLMITILLAGCGKMNTYNVYENLYNCYNGMHSFKAEVTVTSFSNNSENKYTLTQYFKAPGMKRIEYVSEKGGSNTTLINGDKGKIISGFTAEPYELSNLDVEEKDYLMLNTFFDLYYSSEETVVKTSGGKKEGHITLSAQTGSSNPYKNSIELVLNTKTLNPVKMTVKDDKGKATLCVEYIDFQLNPQLEDSIFQ